MTSTAEAIACPVEGCEQTCSDRSGLRRHLERIHDVKTDSTEYRRLMGLRPKNAARAEANAMRSSSVLSEIESEIRQTAKPFRDQLRKISQRLSALDQERTELIAARRKLEGFLKQVDPSSFVASPKKTNSGGHVGSEAERELKRQTVMEFLETNRDRYDEGLTAAGVHRDMKAAGIEPRFAPDKLKKLIEELHAQGVLRADKKIRGGAMSYKFMANGGNNAETS